MKFTLAAATAMAVAIAATTASAGVVITQTWTIKDPGGKTRKSERTVMIQGHKQRIVSERGEVITDLDAGKIYLVNHSTRTFIPAPFPPEKLLASVMMQEGLSVGFKKAPNTHKQNGYACQDYIGGSSLIYNVGVVECVASGAPGAREFTEFQRLVADKLKGTRLAQAGEVPDGIPVSSLIKITGQAIAVTGGISPEQIAKLQADLDKKPTVIGIIVSKIEAKDLPASTFALPTDYRKGELPKPQGGVEAPVSGAAPAPPASAPKPH